MSIVKSGRTSNDLRRLARGQECLVRIPGICTWDTETTVLAHIRRASVAGKGQKPPDVVGVWACAQCHDVIDRRNNLGSYTRSEIDGWLLDALVRQLDRYVKEGILRW